jgi:PhnB protein
MNTITASLWFSGNCKQALEFYQKAFGAELMGEAAPMPDGSGIMHAMMRLGNSHLMMADAWPGFWEQGPKDYATTGLWLYVEDSDALYNKAVKAGCEVLEEIMDAFWGDRMGKVKDPFGHTWAIATHKWIFTPEEMQKGQEEWLASLTSADS